MIIMLIKTTKETTLSLSLSLSLSRSLSLALSLSLSLSLLQRCRSCLVSICWKFEALFNGNKIFYYYMDYGEENLNDLFLLIYKISDHIQRPIKVLIFFADSPVYLSDRHSGGKYQFSIAVSSLCICICLCFCTKIFLSRKEPSFRCLAIPPMRHGTVKAFIPDRKSIISLVIMAVATARSR